MNYLCISGSAGWPPVLKHCAEHSTQGSVTFCHQLHQLPRVQFSVQMFSDTNPNSVWNPVLQTALEKPPRRESPCCRTIWNEILVNTLYGEKTTHHQSNKQLFHHPKLKCRLMVCTQPALQEANSPTHQKQRLMPKM